MKPFHRLIPIIAGLVGVLTYFLVQGTMIDAPRQERAGALQAIILHDASLQRDVLLARTGLLPSYDPLVGSMEGLLGALGDLPAADEIAGYEPRAGIAQDLDGLAQSIRAQETLVEAFKSDNALLQNSLSYFNHLSGRLSSAETAARPGIQAEVGVLATAMLRFINSPRPDIAEEAELSLDRLARPASDPPLAPDIRSLVSHGRLILTMLPRVDELVARIQASPAGGLARALQDAYLDARQQAVTRANIFMGLLYAIALALVIYIALLFVRLRANARTLRARLDFEGLIASISTQFINLPRDEIRSAVGKALAELAGHTSVAGARIIAFRGAEADDARSYLHQRVGASTVLSAEQMLELIRYWTSQGYERRGCLCLADIDTLPDGGEKDALHAAGIRSWLCIPMRVAGECLGVLVLHDVHARSWHDDDIALMRTAAEIFANAITRERSEIEREELQSRLNRSQRLEAVGTLAGGIAHEFNNILGAIRGYSEMALVVLLKESRARRYVQQIAKAGERAQDIVEQVLAFGRRREREHRPIEAEPVIAEAVDLVRASFPATVALRTHFAAKDAAVMGDATEVQQVVMNLCSNAAQAMGGRGVVRIGLKTISCRHATGLSHGSLPPGRYVRLAVKDTGRGIDAATMERIFEPFFSTKLAGQGTGLGLSTVHGIVGAHQGGIDVKSRPGKGTTFEVYFPRTKDAESREHSSETPVPNGHGETVLIVDDDKPLVVLAEEMLAALGYEPVGFDNGQAALAAITADPARFDLILTDEIMPEVTGTELADKVHKIRSDIPIVLMTGYDRPLRPGGLQAAGVREVLKKPLLSRPLADCLARQLAAG